ncbi:uncharacterized protein LOC116431590 isoform X2 [Nomia melanderi]|nr:uncharacterized protein LOC116431590 isoform X2 [Nomia melanderi]XP_031843102.1 uncharacterized protein LOC116431590 isoform X2 [Nomia melanderi]
MAHATLPKLVSKPINTSNMCPTDFVATTPLSDILNSEPVKRLLNQPNIIIKAIPLNVHATPVSHNNVSNKMNNIRSDIKESKQSKLNTFPSQVIKAEQKEDENLLPSKKNGKSEITLVPIKREKKSCGHYEPCENIVCDVTVQQYVDRDGASPMLATNIDEEEINAPVSKHCKNEKCDALSIDHDRCRRATVRLYRCNRSKACDICGIELQTRRCRVHHKNCTRTNEYRHNETDGAQILKVRMREREIQMMEAFKLSRKDYMDPVTAMETLKKNEELIIIPKSTPMQQSMINVTSVSATQPTPQVNSVNDLFGKLLSNIPIVLPQQNLVFGKSQCSNENGVTNPVQVTLSDTLNTSFIASNHPVSLTQNQYVTFATQHNSQPLTLNDILFTQSHVMSTPIQSKPLLTPIQSKPLITPIRIVPITNLLTQPSLLHQTQGIPRYCIVADPPIPVPLTLANPQPMQQSTISLAVTNSQPTQQTTVPLTITNSVPLQQPMVSLTGTNPQPTQQPIVPLTIAKTIPADQRPICVPKNDIRNDSKESHPRRRKTFTRKKRRLRKKEFKCDYCFKCFSTEWYFKMHVAKHTGGSRYPCKICKESFNNSYHLKTHMLLNHEEESPQDHSDVYKKPKQEQSFQCIDCPIECTSMKDLKHHRLISHGRVACTLCNAEVLQDELAKHFATVHNRTDKIANRSEETIENGDISNETLKAMIVSDIIKIGTNNINSQKGLQYENDETMNRDVSDIDEITIENIKVELDDEIQDIPI